MRTWIGLAEGCRWIEAKVIEDDDQAWDEITTVLMDRWGDRKVPKWEPTKFPYQRGIASLNR
jgi:hypothetical protein